MVNRQTVATVPRTGQDAVDRAFDVVAERINRLTRLAVILDGAQVTGIKPAASPTTLVIFHGLNRPYRGYIVTRQQNGTPSDLSETDSPDPSRELRLSFTGSTSIELDLWVF